MAKQATLMLAFAALLAFPACEGAEKSSSLPVTTMTAGSAKLRVEVVSTPEARMRGLMHRTELGENEGMLFVYPEKDIREFWMKDTPLPLSIAFLEDNGTVVNIEDMAPEDPGPRYRSARPVRYAVEVNQGWFARNGIGPGQVLGFELPAGVVPR